MIGILISLGFGYHLAEEEEIKYLLFLGLQTIFVFLRPVKGRHFLRLAFQVHLTTKMLLEGISSTNMGQTLLKSCPIFYLYLLSFLFFVEIKPNYTSLCQQMHSKLLGAID